MPGWEQLGMQAASQTIGGVLGLALGGINDRRQVRQQRRLNELQIAGNKELTDYNTQKQMEMWRNTNYPAQMAMLKQAGLNPALIYDNAGGGASTSITSGNVTGGNAPTGGREVQDMMGMALQRQMIAAQIELTKAQTQKTAAETGAVQPTIEKTQAETKNIGAQQALTELETAFQKETFNDRSATINLALSKLLEEVRLIENNREISDQTKNTQVKSIIQDLRNKVLSGLQIEKQNAKTDKEMQQIDTQIQAIQQQININKLDEQAAAAGVNPKAGTMLKTGYNVITLIKKLLGL